MLVVGVGLLYPLVDKKLGRCHKLKTEWSSVMRCVAVFVGINHASAVSFLLVAVINIYYYFTVMPVITKNVQAQKCGIKSSLLHTAITKLQELQK